MGVLNVTPDSFSDGGHWLDPGAALDRAHRMVADGAALIDVGGESTRPGAAEVSEAEERRRVVPLVERLSRELPVPVSVDTSKPAVMRAAIDAGAGMINDIRALSGPGALAVLAASEAAVCLMHMQGEPRTMQLAPAYTDVLGEVRSYLCARADDCLAAGISRERIVVDPGFGFGKTLVHNLTLLRRLDVLVASGWPVLAGLSRKSMIGAVLDAPVEQRTTGSVAAAMLAAMAGAVILRVHDVRETADALKILAAVTAAA